MSKLSRRKFMKGAAVAGLAAALPLPLFAENAQRAGASLNDLALNTQKLLRIVNRTIDVNGKPAKVFGLIGPDGKQGLSFTEGERFRVKLQNECGEPTLIHWHGLTPDYKQDGVPGVGQPMLPSGQSYEYDFPLKHTGTNWMHAHTLQEQRLMAAPLIIYQDSKEEQDVTLMLHDFSFKSPEEILIGLKAQKPDMMMDEMDHHQVNDIAYDAYLANDRTLSDPEVVKVDTGGQLALRLRIINAATSTGFTIDLGALEGELIAVDGMNVKPPEGMDISMLRSRTFPITMAQRLDIRLHLPKGKGAYPILALAQGIKARTGIILSTGGRIKKIRSQSAKNNPIIGLDLEEKISAETPLLKKAPDRKFIFALRGKMQGYEWSMERLNEDSRTISSGGMEELQVKKGERVHVLMHNQSMMAHPMHLHGHHFQVVAIDEKPIRGAVRDTVLVPPHAKVEFAFDADNPGKFPFHCHHLYHMASGMMSYVTYG